MSRGVTNRGELLTRWSLVSVVDLSPINVEIEGPIIYGCFSPSDSLDSYVFPLCLLLLRDSHRLGVSFYLRGFQAGSIVANQSPSQPNKCCLCLSVRINQWLEVSLFFLSFLLYLEKRY